MRSFKLAKYNIKSSLKSIMIFYCIFITVIICISITAGGSFSGIEFSSMIFLFVMGLNSFKENFYFAQANNIPRIDYFKAVVMTIMPIGIAMSILDVIINRVHNLFGICPTLYDMSYNNLSNLQIYTEGWIQSNSIGTLLGTVTFLSAFYIAAFAVGLLITLIYYNCNKTMKILVSLSPVGIMAIFSKLSYNDPEFGQKVAEFIDNILGISAKNSYTAVLTFICLFLVTMGFVYLLVRKAVVKRD
ncbi:hypothetical protein [Clostridium sp.]|uniref:hypothetical protein n=1 Tax=Clostridium sp. TaxID=1506 RepID=UPI003D6D5D30